MAQAILLVDDDESNRISLSILLEDEGFRVQVAESAAALRALLARGGASYAAVLLDQHLGDGLGTHLLPLVRAALPGAKVMLVSGSADSAAAPDLDGFDGHLPKGIDFPDLLSRLRKVLG